MALKKYQQLVSTIVAIGVIFSHQITLAAFVSPLRTKKAMVVSANPLASDAGLAMLQKGGNAVDAAVATTLAISVVEPFAAGIGGGGFLLIRDAKTGEIKSLDFRERAPLKATKNMYLDAQGKVRVGGSTNGHLAVGVPGTIAGLYEVHQRYGKLPWADLFQPAIALARQGFIINKVVTPRSMYAYEERKKVILSNPAAKAIFTRNGDFYQPGEKLIQIDLSQTLTELSRNPQSFYTGKTARFITADMQKNGGLINLEDLRTYKPIWRTPVCGDFRKVRVCSMPPPSSGGVHLLQILNILGDTDLKTLGWHNPDSLHLLVEAMKIAYADRAEHLGDPDFVKVPVTQLISPAYAKLRRAQIDMQMAKPASEVKPGIFEKKQRGRVQGEKRGRGRRGAGEEGENQRKQFLSSNLVTNAKFPGYESPETSHINVIDSQRNAVSLTFTVNTGFGAGVVATGTGILLNNEMDDFAVAPGVPNSFGLVGNLKNAIAPKKTPLSSMTPTIITEKGQLRMVVGAPGGSTIITQVLQVILNVLEYNMDAGAAVSAAHIHHQWLPDELRVEPFGLDIMTLNELRRRGQNIKETATWGNANTIIVKPDGSLEGAASPRGEGSPRGE
ncbi:gamma-glutamyltransferase [Calothrix sp. PCC 6303]|uniref:gamma-glutamyltransferase n=1 Tax=Calothrix sp. PCC 6303 TaxID=1170562 RepID=UPI0002A03927|nr:gamma-glutamyltransferase [Calothrix sp. PCC 6303]AFZ04118.1 gamma-glutamyltransferase 1 [Calothrix sp. PCC 6303]